MAEMIKPLSRPEDTPELLTNTEARAHALGVLHDAERERARAETLDLEAAGNTIRTHVHYGVTSGIDMTVTRTGLSVGGWYDGNIRIEAVLIPWATIDALRLRCDQEMHAQMERRELAAEPLDLKEVEDDVLRMICPYDSGSRAAWEWEQHEDAIRALLAEVRRLREERDDCEVCETSSWLAVPGGRECQVCGLTHALDAAIEEVVVLRPIAKATAAAKRGADKVLDDGSHDWVATWLLDEDTVLTARAWRDQEQGQ